MAKLLQKYRSSKSMCIQPMTNSWVSPDQAHLPDRNSNAGLLCSLQTPNSQVGSTQQQKKLPSGRTCRRRRDARSRGDPSRRLPAAMAARRTTRRPIPLLRRRRRRHSLRRSYGGSGARSALARPPARCLRLFLCPGCILAAAEQHHTHQLVNICSNR